MKNNKKRIAIIGLGRLGKKHAENLAFKINNCNLVAACSIVEDERNWALSNLDLEAVYDDFEKIIQHPNLDGVFIVSSTAFHPEHIIASLENGLHVFCEKPLGLRIEDCLKVEKVAEKYLNQVCMIGFVRRYDPSMTRLKSKIDSGKIGKPFSFNAQSGDMDEVAEFQIEFAPKSGGLFLDMNIHDFDSIRWISQQEIVKVTAHGGAYCYPGFAKYNDYDNVSVLAELSDGSIATIKGTRTAFHGHSTSMSVQGTKGELTVCRDPHIDYLEMFDEHGIRKDCVRTFYDRFERAFLIEATEYVNYIMNGQPSPITLRDATIATQVCIACKESLETKKSVLISYS